MTKHPRRTFALAAAFILAAAGAQAQGRGHGNGNDKDHEKGKDNGHEQDVERGRGNGKHQERMERRDDVRRGDIDERRDVYDNNGRAIPPGLAKKPGGMPPGQYKKHYSTQQGAGVLRDIFVNRGYTVVRTVNAGPSQYVYYRMNDGSVRRAVVSPGTDQLGFSNVPASLLREVLSRLY